MTNDKIINQILEYIKDDRYRQAVLIDGKWGAGKTFFVKERLMPHLLEELENKKVYYISLYGLSSAEQIITEIYSSIMAEIIDRKFDES